MGAGIGVLVLGCASKPVQPEAPVAGKAKAAPAIDQLRSRNVTELYNSNCSNCHGKGGEGGGAGTQSLLTKEKWDAKWDKPFFDTIKNGISGDAMPAYGETLSDEAIWALVVHIRELQRDHRQEFDPWPTPDAQGITSTSLTKYRTQPVLENTGLGLIWAIDWLPDGGMLVTDLTTGLFLARNGKIVGKVSNVPKFVHQGQGGCMQVKLHPNFAKNRIVYLTLADPKAEGSGAMTKVVRGILEVNGDTASLNEVETVFKADQKFYSGAQIHFGSKIAFDKSGKMFFTVGERGQNEGSRPIDVPYGKVYRVNDDGTAPADNPFHGKGNEYTDKAYTIGHRNQQGLAFDLEGNLWATEHGPRGGDELNLIKPGADYGWPLVCFGINYNDSPFRLPWPKPDQNITMPAYRWLPSIAASGLACVPNNSPFKAWRGDLLAGGLAGETVDRIRVKNGKVVEKETVWKGRDRVRDVAIGPDGLPYFVLNTNPNRVVKIVPVP